MIIEKYAEKPVRTTDPGVIMAPMVEQNLASFVRGQWERAVAYKSTGGTNKKSTIERLLSCERQRRGEYDQVKLNEIRQIGGSEIFLMLTDVKASAAEAWIKDVLQTAGDRLFDLTVSSDPEMPVEIERGIIDLVRVEAAEFAQSGEAVHPEAFRARMEQVHEEIVARLRKEAEDSALRCAGAIQDALDSGGFAKALNEFIVDLCTYPSAIMKGPVVRRRRKMTWGKNFKPIVSQEITREFNRVSPYDFFPSPKLDDVNKGYICERHNLDAQRLDELKTSPGYNREQIEMAIAHYGISGLKSYLQGDEEHSRLEGKGGTFIDDGGIEGIEYWGPVSGDLLLKWGLRDKSISADRIYECNVWLVGSYVIRAVINPHPLGHRPYRVSSFEKIPGSIWGKAIAERMEDVQSMANAAARALSNNMGIGSGPQVEVVTDRLPTGAKITTMYPFKVWQTTSDKTGGGQPGVRFFSPDMHAAELLGIINQFMKYADEVTGIPNYIYGSSNVAGAGRTASGLSMLMDNAAKGIKQCIANVDLDVLAPSANALYTHLMMFSDDKFIKGDFRIKTRGAVGIMHKEQIQIRRQEFLQATANPIDMQIVGVTGRANVLREVAAGLQMGVNKIVPSDEELREKEKQAAAMQQLQLLQQMQGGGQPTSGGSIPPEAMQSPSGAPPGALPPVMAEQ